MRAFSPGVAALVLVVAATASAVADNAVTAPIQPADTVIVFPTISTDQNGSIGVYAMRGGAEVKLGESPITIGGGTSTDEKKSGQTEDFAVTLSDKVVPGEKIMVKFMNMEGQVVDTQELAIPQ